MQAKEMKNVIQILTVILTETVAMKNNSSRAEH